MCQCVSFGSLVLAHCIVVCPGSVFVLLLLLLEREVRLCHVLVAQK